MAFIEIDGVVLHYADEGPREAPTIFFINSLGTDFRIWDGVAADLIGAHRLIRFDKRGHGLSTAHLGETELADYARDAAGLLDRLSVKSATIVGLSIGGMIAQELFRLRPDLVGALVLCDTGHKIGTPEIWAQRLADVGVGGIETIADAVMTRWFSRAFREMQKTRLAGYRLMLTRTPVVGYIRAGQAIAKADLTEGARKINVPTICIVGDEDGSTPPALMRTLADLIPNADYEIIVGAGHLPCLEAPERVAALIKAHVEKAKN